jgi:hypothetical protein
MESVPFVATFGGNAFRLRAEQDATPLMVFRPGSIVLLTEELLTEQVNVTPQTPRTPAEGMLQGVALVVGEGARCGQRGSRNVLGTGGTRRSTVRVQQSGRAAQHAVRP